MSGISAQRLGLVDTSNHLNEPGSLAEDLISDNDTFTNTASPFLRLINVNPKRAGLHKGSPGFQHSFDVNPEEIDLHGGENIQDEYEFPDEDALPDNADLVDGKPSISLAPPSLASDGSDSLEENSGPYLVESLGAVNDQISEVPPHLLVVYVMVTWLHLQFHLPRVACNTLLAFLSILIRFFKLAIAPPFIMLHSATRALGADPGVILLAVCPKCRGIYPSSGSRHAKETCNLCHVSLFLPEYTRQGNRRGIKTPVIKYPYLPLSNQIALILRIPGVKVLLDAWCTKPHKTGEYSNIFDGNMCQLKLKAPDGSLFFSNNLHEIKGPNNELWIGVNLGIDWYVLYIASSDLNSPSGFLISLATSHHPIHHIRLHF